MTLRARSCPTCRSIGAPRIVPGVPDMPCMDVWHDPTPSDSQDGARRRDDAVAFRLTRQPGGGRSVAGRLHMPSGEQLPLYVRADGFAALETVLTSVARLEAERDEARAIAEDWRAATKRYDRAWIKLKAEQDAMRPVVEAAKAFRDATAIPTNSMAEATERAGRLRPIRAALFAAVDQTAPPETGPPDVGSVSPATLDLIAAATGTSGATEFSVEYEDDQTAPSSPQETPQTADNGEAGVVEGAGGSEAAEGEQVAEWELQAINDEYARRMAATPRRPEGRTPLRRERAAALVGSNTRVRVWLNHNGGLGDEGVVIGYLDRPSVIIQRPDGSQSSWSIDLDYEELGTDG